MRAANNRLYIEEAGIELTDVLTAMGIAGMGGLVGWLRRRRRKNFGTFFAAVITAAFTGLLSHLLTDWLALDTHLQYAISGAAGYSGGILLDAIAPMLVHLVHSKTADMSGTERLQLNQRKARRESESNNKSEKSSDEDEAKDADTD